MANQGISGYGTTVKFTNGTSTTTIAEVKDVSWTSGGLTAIDISTMESTDKWRDYVPGMKDPGDISVTVNFEDANNTALLAMVGVKGTWTIQLNDATAPTNGSKYACAGWLNPYGLNNPMDDMVDQVLTVKLSGALSYTAKT